MNMTADSWDIFLSLMSYLGYIWCASRFLKKHLQANISEEGVFCGLLFCGYGTINLFLKRSSIPYIFYAVCHHILLVVVVMTVFRGEKEKKLLVAVILEAMTSLIWNFSESFLSCIGLFLVHTQQMNSLGVCTGRIIMLMTYVAGIISINVLSKPLSPVFSDKRKKWYLYLTIPLICIILITDLANWAASNGIMVQDWENYGLYENQLFSHSAMCIFTGLAITAAGFLVFGMDRIDREERSREQYQSQVMYYQMMEEQYSQMERLRHDMKNHMIAMESLVQNKQWKQANSYLKEMETIGCVAQGDEVTGSLVMDALLYHKRHQAAEWGIHWQCDAKLPKDSPVKEIDLCIIMGNILDNAIEACCRIQELNSQNRKDKENLFIKVHIGTIKKCLFMEVQNSTDLQDKDETCRSRKDNPSKHGVGLANIKAAVANYNGVIHMEVEKGVFTISILVPMYHEDFSNTL